MHLIDQVRSTSRPLIMGILNVTPDSFSDGGRYQYADQIKQRIELMALQGADIIDVGGESTRPGAQVVSVEQELERVLPVIDLCRQYSDCWISVDTYKPEVMRSALSLGIDLINDVNALQSPKALSTVAESNAMVCLMHKQGLPETMQLSPVYQDVYAEVVDFLQQRVQACNDVGISSERLILDPGFGFGKNLLHNIALFQKLGALTQLGYPLLVGVSRKTMIGQILQDLPVAERMVGSVVAAVLAAQQGARILRVHDVAETVQALNITKALSGFNLNPLEDTH